MKITLAQAARLEFLARVTDKACRHLLYTDGRIAMCGVPSRAHQPLRKIPHDSQRPGP